MEEEEEEEEDSKVTQVVLSLTFFPYHRYPVPRQVTIRDSLEPPLGQINDHLVLQLGVQARTSTARGSAAVQELQLLSEVLRLYLRQLFVPLHWVVASPVLRAGLAQPVPIPLQLG